MHPRERCQNQLSLGHTPRMSRSSRGGTHTTGSVPARCSRISPRQSSRSVLFWAPSISFAFPAATSCGVHPASSSSSVTQYQFPTVSTATRLRLCPRQELPQGPSPVDHLLLPHQHAVRPFHPSPGVALVHVQGDVLHLPCLLPANLGRASPLPKIFAGWRRGAFITSPNLGKSTVYLRCGLARQRLPLQRC